MRLWLALALTALLLSGCALPGIGGKSGTSPGAGAHASIERYTGAGSPQIDVVYTGERKFAVTFNGMGDRATMTALLDELDRHHMRATFFLPGMRVAEEPDIAIEIVERGHEIENNTLNRLDMSNIDYELMYNEVKLANDVIEQHTGIRPRYVRTRSGDIPADLPLVAAQLGMEGAVSYSINPRDRDMQDAETIGTYVARYLARGKVVTLNTDINPEIVPAIAHIAQAAAEAEYAIVPLGELLATGGFRLPPEQTPGYELSTHNADYENAEYKLIYTMDTSKLADGEKIVALTLDDWGTERTVNEVLDILKEYDVPSTFFLRANGVEANPNLARAMVDDGHDVANHTYSHPVATTLDTEQLQEEVVKAHQLITWGIQQEPVMLFRPPTGAIDDRSAKVIAAAGYPLIAMYDVTTLDWDPEKSADDIVQVVKDRTQNGSIILLHILDGINTIEALPIIIEYLRSENYTFVKMMDYIDTTLPAREGE